MAGGRYDKTVIPVRNLPVGGPVVGPCPGEHCDSVLISTFDGDICLSSLGIAQRLNVVRCTVARRYLQEKRAKQTKPVRNNYTTARYLL